MTLEGIRRQDRIGVNTVSLLSSSENHPLHCSLLLTLFILLSFQFIKCLLSILPHIVANLGIELFSFIKAVLEIINIQFCKGVHSSVCRICPVVYNHNTTERYCRECLYSLFAMLFLGGGCASGNYCAACCRCHIVTHE